MKNSASTSEKKILVSNPGKQYVHQLLLALKKNKLRFQFFTSFWYKPGKFPFTFVSLFPLKIRQKIEAQFRKRYFDKLDSASIVQFPYFEILREMSDKLFGQKYAEKMQYYRDRLHDRWVSSRIDHSFDVVIGYEEASLRSFRRAKRLGITTVLDLAQVHYREIESIAERFPVFRDLYRDKALREKIDRIKDEELALADVILCLSGYARKTLTDHGISPSKIRVVNLGFDPQKFLPKDNYVASGKLKIIFAGTVTRRKGIDTILKVHRELAEHIDLTLVGPMADAQDLLDAHGLPFTWHPFVEQQRLNELYRESDLFVFPSYLDSWAMVVVEAMACGIPVIVSENTGAKEAVSNDSGFIIAPGDAVMLKEKIGYFIKNRSAVETMGRNARKEALNYTWDRYYKSIGDVIKKPDTSHGQHG